MEKKPTLIDFFCGGGLGLGFQQAGFEILKAYEIDKYGEKVHLPGVIVEERPTTFKVEVEEGERPPPSEIHIRKEIHGMRNVLTETPAALVEKTESLHDVVTSLLSLVNQINNFAVGIETHTLGSMSDDNYRGIDEDESTLDFLRHTRERAVEARNTLERISCGLR